MLKLCILGMSIALVGGVGVVSMSATHEQNENVVNINRENKKLVSYDDEGYEITLSANELNNYVWNNFNDYITSNFTPNTLSISNAISEIQMNEIEFSFDDFQFLNDDNNSYLSYRDISENIIEFNYDDFSNETANKFYYTNIEEQPFNQSIVLIFQTQAYYNAFKNVIELDIQANMDSSNAMPSISDLFQQVTAAVNAFIGSLGDAFTQVTSLFWVTEGTNQGPTFLGLLILIGVGVGLVYLAYRTIRSLIHRI